MNNNIETLRKLYAQTSKGPWHKITFTGPLSAYNWINETILHYGPGPIDCVQFPTVADADFFLFVHNALPILLEKIDNLANAAKAMFEYEDKCASDDYLYSEFYYEALRTALKAYHD